MAHVGQKRALGQIGGFGIGLGLGEVFFQVFLFGDVLVQQNQFLNTAFVVLDGINIGTNPMVGRRAGGHKIFSRVVNQWIKSC